MANKMHFTISELVITGKTLPLTVADKLLEHHIVPMNKVRTLLGVPVTASQKSGYRPVSWEKKKKRSGNSQHTFKIKGAIDWTCEDFKEHKDEFLSLIITHTRYTRMAVYKGFIHCDYKPTPSGKREIYKSNSKSEWTLIDTI